EGVDVAVALQAEPVQERLDLGADPLPRPPADPRAVCQLVVDRAGDELVLGVLEHVADLRGQFAGGDPRDVAPAHPHRAARAGPISGDRLGQGGLARAVAADDGEEVVLGNVHLHPVQGEAVAAPDGEPADLDGGGGDGGGGRASRPQVWLGGRGGGSRVRIARFPRLLRPGRFEGRGRIPGGGVVVSPGGGRGRTRNRGGALLFPGGGGGQVRGRGGGGGE